MCVEDLHQTAPLGADKQYDQSALVIYPVCNVCFVKITTINCLKLVNFSDKNTKPPSHNLKCSSRTEDHREDWM